MPKNLVVSEVSVTVIDTNVVSRISRWVRRVTEGQGLDPTSSKKFDLFGLTVSELLSEGRDEGPVRQAVEQELRPIFACRVKPPCEYLML
jgi:hypothetical protein